MEQRIRVAVFQTAKGRVDLCEIQGYKFPEADIYNDVAGTEIIDVPIHEPNGFDQFNQLDNLSQPNEFDEAANSTAHSTSHERRMHHVRQRRARHTNRAIAGIANALSTAMIRGAATLRVAYANLTYRGAHTRRRKPNAQLLTIIAIILTAITVGLTVYFTATALAERMNPKMVFVPVQQSEAPPAFAVASLENEILELEVNAQETEPTILVDHTTAIDDRPDYEKAFPLSTRIKMAKMLNGEAEVVKSEAERAMVLWVPLNRLDSGISWFGEDLDAIITKDAQFAYDEAAPVTERNLALVNDVCARWYREKMGETDVGRVLPSHVLFFETYEGPGWHNMFFWYDHGLYGERYDFGFTPFTNPYNS